MSDLLPKSRQGQGGFKALAHSAAILQYLPYTKTGNTSLHRKSLEAPVDNDTFVKPVKQCFIKNPRTMPMTRIMLMLLAGWAGQGGSIKTTTGILAKHLGRCRRQVFRYLKDAMEEGYLTYTRTKDRIGRYTGIQIFLNFGAIRFTKFQKAKKRRESAETLDVTHKAETNTKSLLNNRNDDLLNDKLEHLASVMGYELPPPIPK